MTVCGKVARKLIERFSKRRPRYLECGRDERAVKSTESSFVLEGGRTLSIETKEAGVDWRKANKSTRVAEKSWRTEAQ